jgi:hypothetical protein
MASRSPKEKKGLSRDFLIKDGGSRDGSPQSSLNKGLARGSLIRHCPVLIAGILLDNMTVETVATGYLEC